jgi:hypothetical protein
LFGQHGVLDALRYNHLRIIWVVYSNFAVDADFLDAQGFYDVSFGAPSPVVMPLARTSMIMSVVLIFTLFITREQLARSVFFVVLSDKFFACLLKRSFFGQCIFRGLGLNKFSRGRFWQGLMRMLIC